MLSSATAREGSKINKSYVRNLITDFRTIRRQIPSDLSLMQLPLWRGPPTRPKNSTALGFRPAILYLSSPSPPADPTENGKSAPRSRDFWVELSRNPRVSGRVIPGHPLWRHYDLINSFDFHTFKRAEPNPRGCEEARGAHAPRSSLAYFLFFHISSLM